MMSRLPLLSAFIATLAVTGAAVVIEPALIARQNEVGIVITGNTGAKKRLAVPEFSAPGAAADVQQAAKLISDVLWDDLDFEGEFTMVARDAAAKVPPASTMETLPYDRWSELGADAVVLGSVTAGPAGLSVRVQVVGTRGDLARKQIFGKSYGGGGCNVRNPRYCAHYISDDFYKSQGIDGVARSRLAFVSDRSTDAVSGRVVNTTASEIYISDYDGANATRITVNKGLNTSPAWSPDGRALAYTSYVSYGTSFAARFPDIVIHNIYEVGKQMRPAGGSEEIQSAHPAWSPDGSRIAFASKRGTAKNFNIHVVNRDGTGMRQLTTGDTGDVAPVWSPAGNQIAFVSGRSGKAQLYLVQADGTGFTRLSCQEAECDHPSWSGAANKIAYTCGASSGYDICLLDMASRQVAKLTDGLGSNEQPSFAPNGRHVVFVTTRWGKKQLAMVDLKGNITKLRVQGTGNNSYPNWSHAPQ
jgi:TolB protein